MKTPPILLSLPILLVLSLSNWNVVDALSIYRNWFLLYYAFSIVVGVHFSLSFLNHYNVRPYKKWLIPAALVVVFVPLIFAFFLEDSLKYITTITFHIASLFVGLRMLSSAPEFQDKKSKEKNN